MTIINVPDIKGPTAQLCFKQKLDPPHVMVRCDRRKGHSGLHSWEMVAQIEELTALPPSSPVADSPTQLPDGPVGDLLAFGQGESTMALVRKDRDSYQFWQGWNAALSRLSVPSLAVTATDSPTWQPIETAPTDGTRVLIAWPNGAVQESYFSRLSNRWNHNAPITPTHWMPLPSAPSPSAGAAQEHDSKKI